MVQCGSKGVKVDPLNPVLEDEIKGQLGFVSTFTHSLDPKRRLTIPSEWRTQIGEPRSLYVLPGIHEECLCIFPAQEMLRRLERMRRHSIADTRARTFARVLASQSDLVSWDNQGRIRIKDHLLDYAHLSDQVVLVGAFDSFELWNSEAADKAGSLDPAKLQEAAQYVGF